MQSEISPSPPSGPHLRSLIPTASKLHLSCSFSTTSLSFSLHKKSNFRSIVTFVAAQQEDDNIIVLEQGEVADVSESEGEVAEAEASGEEDEDAGQFSDPPEEAKIFIGNLPYDLDSEKLAQVFEHAGVVEIAEKKVRMHPSMYEDNNILNLQSSKPIRSSKRQSLLCVSPIPPPLPCL